MVNLEVQVDSYAQEKGCLVLGLLLGEWQLSVYHQLLIR